MTKPINPSRPLSERYCQPWSLDEDGALREMVGYLSRADIGKRLGRTPLAVQGRCKHLGLRLIRDDLGQRRFYTPTVVENRAKAEENDMRFVRALAAAIYRGDHLPGASNVG